MRMKEVSLSVFCDHQHLKWCFVWRAEWGHSYGEMNL